MNAYENNWKALVTNTDDVIQIVDLAGTILYANRVYPPHRLEGVVGKTIYDFLDPEKQAIHRKMLVKLGRGEGPQTTQAAIRLTATHTVYFESKWLPVAIDGEVAYAIAVARDITRKTEAEAELHKVMADLEGRVARRTHELSVQVRELDCLYGLFKIFNRPETPLQELLEQALQLICDAWKDPDRTCARIVLDDMKIETGNFRKTRWELTSDITLYGDLVGVLEVGYLGDLPEDAPGPFCDQEKNLLAMIAQHLGHIVSRNLMEEALKGKARRLEEMNIALNTLLEKRQVDRADFEIRFVENSKLLIQPHLERLRVASRDADQVAVIDTISEQLNDIAATFTHALTSRHYGLSPTEIKVASLVRSGKNSREIAAVLDISEKTVKNHRHQIRKKLGINNKGVNMRTFLTSLEFS